MDLLLPMLGNHQSLINIIEATRGKSEDEVGYFGRNAATLAVKVDKGVLEGRDFSDTVIKGADFTSVSLRGLKLTGTSLNESRYNT